MHKKPQSPSDIPSWALKDDCNETYMHLTFVFNEHLKNSIFPQKLKKAIVGPIYKKDDPEVPENYRPISITKAKLIEKLLHKQSIEYVLSQNLLTNTQFGLRTSYSSIVAIFFYRESFRKMIET